MADNPFEKYEAELASVGLTPLGGTVMINMGDHSCMLSPDWVGPVHKFKNFRKHTKTVDRLIRCHERNGVKALLVFNSYYVHRIRVQDPETKMISYQVDHTKPVEDRFNILFSGRGKVVSIFDSNRQLLRFNGMVYEIDRFFDMASEEQDATIEPDEFVRMIAKTARQM